MIHKKKRDPGSLSVTSLMDAMTILLLFLLKNLATDGVILTNADDLILPLSESKRTPDHMSVQIAITPTNIFFDNISYASVEEVRKDTVTTIQYRIEGLAEALERQAALEQQMVLVGAMTQEEVGQIIIQGDRNMEYDILYKVLLTCANTGYNNIRFAVMQKQPH